MASKRKDLIVHQGSSVDSFSLHTPSPRGCTRRSSPQVVVAQSKRTPPPSAAIPIKRKRRRRKNQPQAVSTTVWWVVVAVLVCTVLVVVLVKEKKSFSKNPILRHLNNNNNTMDYSFGEVVHVIETRLMQLQPGLIDLGLARLQIFKHFCLPTIFNQTSQDFLWIIRTDPNLRKELKQELLELVSGRSNYLVVASNANPEGFRQSPALDFSSQQVWSGSHDLATKYHGAAQTHLVLETRLDADDGLHTTFVENIQRVALTSLQPNNDDNKKWLIFCAYSHLEWHASNPFAMTEHEEPHGYLAAIKRRDCVTPGLTTGYGLNVTRADLPAGQHAKLHKALPSCTDTIMTRCLMRFGKLYPGAIRARSPTSAGMNGVIFGKYGNRKMYRNAVNQLDLQQILWGGVEKAFCITKQDTAAIRSYLMNHLVDIAKDNLKGQCTKGHSCKSKSQRILKEIIKNGAEKQPQRQVL